MPDYTNIELPDYLKNDQDDAPRVVWKPLPGSQTLSLSCPAAVILTHGTRGPGKRVSNNTPVLTSNGWKDAGDITYNDKLVAIDGSFCNVVGIFPCSDRPLYNVEFYDGTVIEADDEHRWLTLNSKTGYREGWKVRTTEQLRKMSGQCSVPYLRGAVHGEKWEGIDPYAIGYVIANGTTGSRDVTVYSIDDEILNYFETHLGWKRYEVAGYTAKRAVAPYSHKSKWIDLFNGHHKADQKFIPGQLLRSDPETRLRLLQGLMDGDGYCDTCSKSEYKTVSLQLAKDVTELVRSLGGWAKYHRQTVEVNDSRYGDRDYIYRVKISHHNQFNPFWVSRKSSKVGEQKKFLTRGIKSITYSRHGDGVCFSVDHPDHCFVIKDYVVTHNTDGQLMRFRRFVGQGYGKYFRGIIFDREYKNLDDIVSKSRRWFPEFNDGAEFKTAKSDYKWVWPTGEELLFRTLKDAKDYWSYHGQEFPWIGWNELTKYPTDELFEAMMSCNRSSFRPEDHPIKDESGNIIGYPPPLPLEVFATTNPFGPGHNWVKKRFIDKSRPGEILQTEVEVFNPRTQQREIFVKTQCHIFGSYRENIYLDPQYVAELEAIQDPNKRAAWLGGSWDITSGGMFDDVWSTTDNIVAPFMIPSSWKIFRSYDHGLSKPFSVGWWAESDGSDYTLPNGKVVSSVRGDLFRIAEWYGWTGKQNQGLNLLTTEISKGIIERELAMGIHNRVKPGPADNAIWNVEDANSVAAKMGKNVVINGSTYKGVTWTRSDKSPGSRKARWNVMRISMKNAHKRYMLMPDGTRCQIPREEPGLFVFSNCERFIDLIPSMPRDEVDLDDIDTNCEDHIADEAGYAVASTSLYKAYKNIKGT